LEDLLGRFILNTDKTLFRMEKGIESLQEEMKEFKAEMKDFKDRIDRDHKAMNKQWGNLANKMGTIVEDIVAPAIRPTLRKYFDVDPIDITTNFRRRNKQTGENEEIDVLAITEDKVFVVEVKSSPREEHIFNFKEKKLVRFRKFFPEYKDKQLIPIFASLRFEEDMINLASKHGIYLLAYREWEYMDILNFDRIR
jgi:Holliday junction resolvase-like predicted endonuclease